MGISLAAIDNRDHALVQGCLLAIGLTYVLVNFVTDVAYQSLFQSKDEPEGSEG